MWVHVNRNHFISLLFSFLVVSHSMLKTYEKEEKITGNLIKITGKIVTVSLYKSSANASLMTYLNKHSLS